MTVFLDTGFILALTDSRDVNYEKAGKFKAKIEEFDLAFISDYIFDEVMTFIASRQSASKARKIGKEILESDLEIINITPELFEKSWKLFNERENLSFTDCSTVVVARQFRIKNIATFDSGFNQFRNEIHALP